MSWVFLNKLNDDLHVQKVFAYEFKVLAKCRMMAPCCILPQPSTTVLIWFESNLLLCTYRRPRNDFLSDLDTLAYVWIFCILSCKDMKQASGQFNCQGEEVFDLTLEWLFLSILVLQYSGVLNWECPSCGILKLLIPVKSWRVMC